MRFTFASSQRSRLFYKDAQRRKVYYSTQSSTPMRASLRPQKRDHASAANTPTHRKVVHLRRCAEALLKSALTTTTTHKDDATTTHTHTPHGDDCTPQRLASSPSSSSLGVALAAEISLKAIRTAREGDLPRRLIDRDNYCPRCGTPKLKKNKNGECRPAQEETTPMQTTATKTRRCSCCDYSFERKKSKTKKKKKKKRRRKEQVG